MPDSHSFPLLMQPWAADIATPFHDDNKAVACKIFMVLDKNAYAQDATTTRDLIGWHCLATFLLQKCLRQYVCPITYLARKISLHHWAMA